jgi:hypothetical protein
MRLGLDEWMRLVLACQDCDDPRVQAALEQALAGAEPLYPSGWRQPIPA